MKTESFSSKSRAFIQSLIRQRTYLNRHHLTQADATYLEAQINFLKTHLLLNQYTDKQMAGFWMRHHDRIFSLIPGVHCPSSKSQTQKFDDLKAEAGRIFTQSMITPEIVSYENITAEMERRNSFPETQNHFEAGPAKNAAGRH